MTIKHLFPDDNRRERLNHIIGDYLTDDDATAATFYCDIKKELGEWSTYHKESLRKCEEMQALFNGPPVYDETTDPFGGR